jgi:hypothetical protein
MNMMSNGLTAFTNLGISLILIGVGLLFITLAVKSWRDR